MPFLVEGFAAGVDVGVFAGFGVGASVGVCVAVCVGVGVGVIFGDSSGFLSSDATSNILFINTLTSASLASSKDRSFSRSLYLLYKTYLPVDIPLLRAASLSFTSAWTM